MIPFLQFEKIAEQELKKMIHHNLQLLSEFEKMYGTYNNLFSSMKVNDNNFQQLFLISFYSDELYNRMNQLMTISYNIYCANYILYEIKKQINNSSN